MCYARSMAHEPLELRHRIERLRGTARGTAAWLASALGMTRAHVSKMLSGSVAAPPWLAALVELLERVPPERWPKRWREDQPEQSSEREPRE